MNGPTLATATAPDLAAWPPVPVEATLEMRTQNLWRWRGPSPARIDRAPDRGTF
eukprot:gene33275-38639_t